MSDQIELTKIQPANVRSEGLAEIPQANVRSEGLAEIPRTNVRSDGPTKITNDRSEVLAEIAADDSGIPPKCNRTRCGILAVIVTLTLCIAIGAVSYFIVVTRDPGSHIFQCGDVSHPLLISSSGSVKLGPKVFTAREILLLKEK